MPDLKVLFVQAFGRLKPVNILINQKLGRQNPDKRHIVLEGKMRVIKPGAFGLQFGDKYRIEHPGPLQRLFREHLLYVGRRTGLKKAVGIGGHVGLFHPFGDLRGQFLNHGLFQNQLL